MDFITKENPKRNFNPYATICGGCHRLKAMWSKQHGILMSKECKCTKKDITSNIGDSIYE
jgi:hypothetical protein